MAEGDGGEGGVAVGGVVVKGAVVDGGSGAGGDGEGVVGGAGVEDVDVVGPGDGVEGCGEVALFVFGEDEDGDWRGHLERWYRGSGVCLIPRAGGYPLPTLFCAKYSN